MQAHCDATDSSLLLEQRQRRSGVVSTKEKVQSWLERENPVQQVVDSDGESHFPDMDGASSVSL